MIRAISALTRTKAVTPKTHVVKTFSDKGVIAMLEDSQNAAGFVRRKGRKVVGRGQHPLLEFPLTVQNGKDQLSITPGTYQTIQCVLTEKGLPTRFLVTQSRRGQYSLRSVSEFMGNVVRAAVAEQFKAQKELIEEMLAKFSKLPMFCNGEKIRN